MIYNFPLDYLSQCDRNQIGIHIKRTLGWRKSNIDMDTQSIYLLHPWDDIAPCHLNTFLTQPILLNNQCYSICHKKTYIMVKSIKTRVDSYVLDSKRSVTTFCNIMRARAAIKMWWIVLKWGTCKSSVKGEGRFRNIFSGNFPATLAFLQNSKNIHIT